MSEFFNISREVALAFLQTAVIVDDGAFMVGQEHPDKASSEQILPQLSTPGRGSGSSEQETRIEPERAQRPLNAKEITDSFAKDGLTCAILRPYEGEEIVNSTLRCSQRSDIVVLDWKLKESEEGGETTLKIIQKILETDNKQRGRLRLIAIYTAEPRLTAIVEKIKNALPEDLRKKVNDTDDGHALRFGSTLITTYAKDDVVHTKSERAVSDSELPARLIDDFTTLTNGLISNVALASFAALRNGTHHILERLHPELDYPYLSHRALLTQPDDAAELAVELVMGEVRAILEHNAVGSHANIEAINAWVDARFEEDRTFSYPNEDFKPISRKSLKLLLNRGRDNFGAEHASEKKIKSFMNKFKTHPSELFMDLPTEASFRDLEFARLTTVRGRLGTDDGSTEDPLPMLDLGTILRTTEKSEGTSERHSYWLCVQPRCDCVRIESTGRSFPLLPLEVIDEDSSNSKKFTFVVFDPDAEKHIKLKLISKPYGLRMADFKPKPGDHDTVRATKRDSSLVFQSETGELFVWIDILKSEFAQKVANDFAAQIARVGVSPSEWLRLLTERER